MSSPKRTNNQQLSSSNQIDDSHYDGIAFLKEHLDERVRINSSLSLRSFAVQIGMAPGSLSQILSRKKRLSLSRAHEISERMKLSEKQRKVFLSLVELDVTPSVTRKAELLASLKEIEGKTQQYHLTLDQFQLISSWVGLAVLQLITDCEPELTNLGVARRLGVTVAEVDASIERLLRLGLIVPAKPVAKLQQPTAKKREGNRFDRAKKNIVFEAKEIPEALKQYYLGLQEKVEHAVLSQSTKERISGAEVFAFDAAQLPEVKRLTNEYLDSLNNLAQLGKNRTEVYQAVTHFFCLTDGLGRRADQTRLTDGNTKKRKK